MNAPIQDLGEQSSAEPEVTIVTVIMDTAREARVKEFLRDLKVAVDRASLSKVQFD